MGSMREYTEHTRATVKSIACGGAGGTTERREGEHTLRGLAGVYQCRINIIVVSSNNHHTKASPLPSRNNHLVTFSLISPMFKATLSTIYQSGALKLVHQLYLSGDAVDCGKRVLFGISFENYLGIYRII